MTMTSVTLSESAARRIGEILKTEPEGAMLRVSVEGGGCSGFQYKFDIDRAQAADDMLKEVKQLKDAGSDAGDAGKDAGGACARCAGTGRNRHSARGPALREQRRDR
jgi:hypothetical protein